MVKRSLTRLGLIGCLSLACGLGCSSTPAPKAEPDLAPSAPLVEEEEPAEESLGEADESGASEPAEEPEPEVAAQTAEPTFTQGMSVEQAINAVPAGSARVNLDTQALAEPLSDYSLYAPCSPAERQKWTVKVAIWRGKAVGVDVLTTPKNANLERCIRERVEGLEWRAQVPSLNTVEYSF